MNPKRPTSFRLSEEALRVLAQLAKEQGISQGAVLELMLRKAKKAAAARWGKKEEK